MADNNSKQNLIERYYKQHYNELTAFAGKYLGHADMAEDLVQTTFLRLLSSDKVLSEVTLPCLIYTVLRNLTFDYWRRRHSSDEYEHYIKCRSRQAEPESVYSAFEINEMLERGMARLSEPQRTVYRLNIFDGMKVADISQTLQINYKCVENRLGMARKEMRTYMRRMLA